VSKSELAANEHQATSGKLSFSSRGSGQACIRRRGWVAGGSIGVLEC
jgi:hypothetical protein